MTDVVTIAKERRQRLQVEIARLDDFIHMAGVLLRYGKELERSEAKESEPAAPVVLLNELDLSAPTGRDDGATGKPVPTSGAAPAVAKAASAAGSSDQTEDHFVFGPSARADDDLVLTDRVSDEDAVIDAHVGRRLRQRRWMMVMTKKQLAEKVGVEVEQISRSESGEARISSGDMWHIAAALGVPMSYFYEDGDKEAEEHGESGEPDVLGRAKGEMRVAQTA